MLGRYAHDVTEQRKGQPIETQAQQEESASKSKEALWQIMVSEAAFFAELRTYCFHSSSGGHDANRQSGRAIRHRLRKTTARRKVQDLPGVHRHPAQVEEDDEQCRKVESEMHLRMMGLNG